MGIQIKWDDSGRMPDKTVIMWTFVGQWDWLDYDRLVGEAYQMQMEMMPQTVDTIVDMRGTTHIPYSGAIANLVRGINKVPPNRGTVAILGASGLLKALAPIIRRLTPKSGAYILVDSLEDVYQLLETRRASSTPPD